MFFLTHRKCIMMFDMFINKKTHKNPFYMRDNNNHLSNNTGNALAVKDNYLSQKLMT